MKIGVALDVESEEQLVHFLTEIWDAFAWTPRDMSRIDPNFLRQRLTIIPDTQLVVQRRKRLGEKKMEGGKGENQQIQYPTLLANNVMVKKPNNKWKMCTNYTNLNKACPKDPYLLPSINQLVDGASRRYLLCFMDAYSEYNQIKIHLEDEAKTSFITDARAFCYKVMPFNLKNVGATYQWLMDRVFKDIMGRDVEARKFLEFMLIERGIEANPKKCQAIIDMRSPRNIKEVQ
ncbi:hypothetical protein CR513_62640, partial [Mucuna pruriens]